MNSELYPRAPMVTFEVPLHPPVPDSARPYWWGNSTLTFRDEQNRVVWEGTFPHPEGYCRVERRRSFGWIIVLTVRHDRARKVMAAAGIADRVTGQPTSRWSYWGENGDAEPERTQPVDLCDVVVDAEVIETPSPRCPKCHGWCEFAGGYVVCTPNDCGIAGPHDVTAHEGATA